jgi:hypothetical protein
VPDPLLQPGAPLARMPARPTLRQLLPLVVDAFAFSKRYVDDLKSLMNPVFQLLTYTTQTLGPITGIYPPTLNLKRATASRSGLQPLPFLDLHITPIRRLNGSIFLEVRLYDKRQEPAFARLGIQRFPHAPTALAAACKLNIITSRYHVFRRVITSRSNFCLEVLHCPAASLAAGAAPFPRPDLSSLRSLRCLQVPLGALGRGAGPRCARRSNSSAKRGDRQAAALGGAESRAKGPGTARGRAL